MQTEPQEREAYLAATLKEFQDLEPEGLDEPLVSEHDVLSDAEPEPAWEIIWKTTSN